MAELDLFVQTALAKKAEDPVLLDVRGLTSIADFFLILSGRSHRQVTAISEHVVKELKNKNIKSLSVDGIKEGHWVLIDYGHVVVHIFYDAIRRFYDLEGLWVDAKRLRTPSMLDLKDKDDTNGDVEEILVE
ncbi:MAG: ribosome silencing factor [Desulfobacteraceae bacterium]